MSWKRYQQHNWRGGAGVFALNLLQCPEPNLETQL